MKALFVIVLVIAGGVAFFVPGVLESGKDIRDDTTEKVKDSTAQALDELASRLKK